MSNLFRCCKCNLLKDASEFSKDRSITRGLSYSCKTCGATESWVYYELMKNRPVNRPTEGTKSCIECKQIKHVSEYNLDRRRVDFLSQWCRECGRKFGKARSKRLREAGLLDEEYRKYNIKSKGATMEKYETMFINQNGLCAICKKPADVKYTGKRGQGNVKKLHIDHDHETGKLRDLLCHHCNLGLGNFKDDIDNLFSAIDYLLKHGKV